MSRVIDSAREMEKSLQRLLRPMRLKWQFVFLAATAVYGISALHALQVHPRVVLRPAVLRNLDTVSSIVVVFLALLIFHIKRHHFSSRSVRSLASQFLAEEPMADEDHLLRQVLATLQAHLVRVWLLAGLIIATGVLFYWLTHWSRNLHIYFAVGGLSLLLNYPQKSLFAELPWLVQQEWQEAQHPGAEDSPTKAVHPSDGP